MDWALQDAEYGLNSRIGLAANGRHIGNEAGRSPRHIQIIKDQSARWPRSVGPGRCTVHVTCARGPSIQQEAGCRRAQYDHPREPAAVCAPIRAFGPERAPCRTTMPSTRRRSRKRSTAVTAVPLSVGWRPPAPRLLDDFIKYDPRSRQDSHLAKSSYWSGQAGQIGFAASKGTVSREITISPAPSCRLWSGRHRRPPRGSSEYAKSSRSIARPSGRRRRSTVGSTTHGDTEIFGGYLINRRCRSRPGKDMEVGQQVIDHFRRGRLRPKRIGRIPRAQPLRRSERATMTLLQSVLMWCAEKSAIKRNTGNGWVLAANRCSWRLNARRHDSNRSRAVGTAMLARSDPCVVSALCCSACCECFPSIPARCVAAADRHHRRSRSEEA